MSFSRIDVVADAGNLPPDQVRVGVTRPLEQAFQSLPSVTTVTSTSSQGSAELIVAFDSKTDPRADLQYVDQAIGEVRGSVPAAKDVVAVVINPNSEPVLSYALTSPTLSQAVLRDLAVSSLVPKLYGVQGMGRLAVTGGPATEFHVDLDADGAGRAGAGRGRRHQGAGRRQHRASRRRHPAQLPALRGDRRRLAARCRLAGARHGPDQEQRRGAARELGHRAAGRLAGHGANLARRPARGHHQRLRAARGRHRQDGGRAQGQARRGRAPAPRGRQERTCSGTRRR